MDRRTVSDLLFIVDKIFNESELPWLSEILEASERRFDTVSVRNDAPDYASTCAAWLRTFVPRRTRRASDGRRGAVADYARYLAAARERSPGAISG